MTTFHVILFMICSNLLQSEVIVRGSGINCNSTTSVNYIKHFPEFNKTIIGFGCDGITPDLDKLLILDDLRKSYQSSVIIDSNFDNSNNYLLYFSNYTKNGLDLLYYQRDIYSKFFIKNYNLENYESKIKPVPVNFFNFEWEYFLNLKSMQSSNNYFAITDKDLIKLYNKSIFLVVNYIDTYTKNFHLDGDFLYYMNNKKLIEFDIINQSEKEIDNYKSTSYQYNLISKENNNLIYFSTYESCFYKTDLKTMKKDTINLEVDVRNLMFKQFSHFNDSLIYSFDNNSTTIIDLNTKIFNSLDFFISDFTENEFIKIEKNGYSLINKQSLEKETFVYNHNIIKDVYSNEKNIIYTSNNSINNRDSLDDYNVLLNYDLDKDSLIIIDYRVSNPKLVNDTIIYCTNGILKSYSTITKQSQTILDLTKSDNISIKFYDKFNDKYYITDGNHIVWVYDINEKRIIDSLKTYNNYINKIHCINDDYIFLGVSTNNQDFNFIIFDLIDKFVVESSDKDFFIDDEYNMYSIENDKLVYTSGENSFYVYDLLNFKGDEFKTELHFELGNYVLNTYKDNVYFPLTNDEGVNKVLVYNIVSGSFIKEFDLTIDKKQFLFNNDVNINSLKFVFNNEKYLFYFDNNKNLHRVENTFTSVENLTERECMNLIELEYYDMNGKYLSKHEIYNKQLIIKYVCLETNKYFYKLEIRHQN